MTDRPVFARTRHEYGSYQDFWRLVELSGFATCFVDQIRLDSPETFVVTPINGEFRPHIENERRRVALGDGKVRANVIWWALERPDHAGAQDWSETVTDLLQYVDGIWVSSMYLRKLDERVTWVPMGSHARLAEPLFERVFAYDVAMMAYMTPRRQRIADQFVQRGFKLAPNAWGKERDEILRSTRCMLNVHQNDQPAPMEEPLRFALAAAYKLPLVSEEVQDPGLLLYGTDFLSHPYGGLVMAVERVLFAPSLASVLGDNLHHQLCVEHTFERCVLRAMERL